MPEEAKALELVGTLGHAGTEEGVMDFAPLCLPVAGGQAKPAAWTMPLQLVDAEAGVLVTDEITGRGPRRPEAQVYVPAGERRRFELVFRTAKGASLKLNFRGGSAETQHELP